MTSHSHTTSCLSRQIPCQTGSTTFHMRIKQQSHRQLKMCSNTQTASPYRPTRSRMCSVTPRCVIRFSLFRHMSHRRMPISLSACLFVCSGCICRLVTVTHPWPSLLLPSVQHTSGVKVSFQHLSSDTLKSPT